MKRIILIFGCFCLVALNPVFSQETNESKTEQVEKKSEDKSPIACKNKSADSKCCNKGLKAEAEKAQCKNKEKCGGKCKNEGGKTSWWKFW